MALHGLSKALVEPLFNCKGASLSPDVLEEYLCVLARLNEENMEKVDHQAGHFVSSKSVGCSSKLLDRYYVKYDQSYSRVCFCDLPSSRPSGRNKIHCS